MKSILSSINMVLLILFIILVAAAAAFSQNVVLTGNATVSGSGTLKVAGNLDNTGVPAATTVHGEVQLTGTGTQSIGTSGNGALSVDSLRMDSTGTKTMNVHLSVNKNFKLNNGTLTVNSKKLMIDGLASHTGGTLSANSGTDSVFYDAASGTSHIIDGTYKALTISGAATKDLTGVVNTSGAMAHSGGALTINHTFNANAAYAFGTIANILGGDTLNLSTTGGGINTLTDNNGLIINGTGTMGITTITNNHGAITAAANNGVMSFNTITANNGSITGGIGAVNFNNGFTNNGKITGGGGLVTFFGSLNHNADTITAGTGGVMFDSTATLRGGTILSTASTKALTFATNLSVKTGTFALTNNGAASVTGSVTDSAGTLSFSAPSTMTYGGIAQTIAPASYGNLMLNGSGADTVRGAVTVQDSIRLNQDLVMATTSDSVILASTVGNNVSGPRQMIGKVNRSNAFVLNTYYAFNRDSVGLALDTNMTPNLTINMQPNTDFTTPNSSDRAKRFFGITGNYATAKLTELSLVYAQNEVTPGNADEMKFGIRSDVAGTWSKVSNPAGYNRLADSVGNVVLLTGLSSPLVGVNEFGIIKNVKSAIASTNWATGTTWDDGSKPTNSDDVEIKGFGVTVNAGSEFASSLTVFNNPGSILTLSGGNLNVGAGGFVMHGQLNVLSNTLSVAGSNLTLDGPVTNNGTIDVH
ncbi:MAG: beta strand repeat-containing protein [Bacteroidota bacterium]